MTVSLHRLRRSEFELLAEWLAEPLVARWWNHDTSAEALERDFGESADGKGHATVLIAEWDGRPFGLIQYYAVAAYPDFLAELGTVCLLPPGTVSVDYLIGRPDHRRRGLGAAMIATCLERIWRERAEAAAAIVPVHVQNERSWRALERVGFTRVAEGELAPDNPRDSREHYVYRIDRPGLALPAPHQPLSDGTIRLRLPREDDLAVLREYASGPGGLEGVWLPIQVGAPPARLAGLIEDWLRGWAGAASHNGQALLLDIEDAPGFVGQVAFRRHDDGSVELVYGISPGWRGRGLATRAAILATTWLIRERRAPAVELRLGRANRESQRVAEKAGFRLVGTIRERVAGSGQEFDDLHYIYEGE